jgi:FkbM family methyltransferase
MLIKDGHTVEIYDAEWSTSIEEKWEHTRYPLSDMASNWYKYYAALQNPTHKVWREVEMVILERSPEVIGITCRALDLPSALILARIAKSIDKDMVVVLGGPAATTHTEMVLQDQNVDFAVSGEGEITMVELLKALQSPKPDFRSIDGLSFREPSGIVHNKGRALIENISSLPYPARDLLLYTNKLPRQMYVQMMGELVTSRGCPYHCTFCANYSIWGTRKPRMRTPEDVVEEILHQRDCYGVQHFIFWDDLFTTSRQRAVAICNLLLERKANVRWLCLVRANTIDEELLKLMKRAGCLQVQMGVESGSDRILKKMQKGVTVEQVWEAAKMIRRSGLSWHCFLLIGIPGETREEMEATMRLIPELKPNVVELSVFAPYPGSPLHEELQEAGLLNDQDWLFADFLNVDCCYVGTMPREEFRDLALQYLRECDEHNNRMNRPKSRYAYYARHPVLLAKKLPKKLFQVTIGYRRSWWKLSANTCSLTLKALARKVLPAGVRRWQREIVDWIGGFGTNLHLAQFRRKMWTQKSGSLLHCLNYIVRINDGPNFYILYKDIFIKRIYHFEAQRPDPLILDCGSNIGMSILYFKHVYPKARIIGFEPDPAIFPYLEENIKRNGLTDVKLMQAAVAGREGRLTFYSDGKYGSCLADHLPADIPSDWQKYEVPCVRLRDYLTEPVDFLKMNIEGAEWEALADSQDRLRQAREMVVEYHHLPGLPRTLHEILALQRRQGFEYLVNDFDSETNGGVRPPFRLTPESRYYLLIYAKRMD